MTKTESSSDSSPFRFRGGHRALDLTTTLRGRLTPEPTELLATERDLERWLVASGMTARSPSCSETDVKEARILREAIYAIACSLLPDGRPALSAVQRLNEFSSRPAAAPCLDGVGALQWKGTGAQFIAGLAREAVLLFGGDEVDRIRQCQSPSCTIFFVDRSRSGKREWCSMAGCGNKAKVAAFRHRARSTENS